MKKEMMGWQWHQLNHIQIICTIRHAAPHHSIFLHAGMLFLTLNQQYQSTEGKSTEGW